MDFKGDKRNVGLILSGQQVPIPNATLFVTQPTINQIVAFGEDDFLIGVSLLTHTENLLKTLKQGNSELEVYSDFQLLMIVLQEDMSVRNLINKLFELIFPEYIIEITNAAINFSIIDEEANPHLVGQIHPYNFEEFQNLLNDLFEPHINGEEQREFNPANDAAAAIAEKLKKGREKRAQMKGPQSLFGIFCSVLSIGLGMDIKIFYDYTPFQLYDAYVRYFEKQKSDFYARISTMPFMDVSKIDQPEDWSRHLY